MLSEKELSDIRFAINGGAIKDELTAKLLVHIAVLEENATAKDLALKAAKAMQQSETVRADANERDANRYRYIRNKERLHLETDDGEAIMSTTFSSAEEFDEAVDQAMEEQ